MPEKHIMILSYWGIDDVLTQAAVFPHIDFLQETEGISRVVLVTIEREKRTGKSISLPKDARIKHYMIQSKGYSFNVLNKFADFLLFPEQLKNIVNKEKIDAIVASGALAGALAYKVWQKTKCPYYVIFEPHAAYMLENNVWPSHDPRYIFQQKWEKEQIKSASGLILVSENYRHALCQNYPDLNSDRIITGRNPVDVDIFRYKEADRECLRARLTIHADFTVGIYVGKYGDLYYKEEAFFIYKKCFDTIPDFRLIILSPQPKEEIIRLLKQYQIDIAKVHVASVPHEEVPQYLSVADFAFATIKSYPSARYCSPVKIGEYWANGLPVLLTEGVGDDSDIIKKEGGGATFNLQEEGSVERALQQILQILQDPSHRQEIPKLAQKYRSPERIREAYEYFFGQKQEGQK